MIVTLNDNEHIYRNFKNLFGVFLKRIYSEEKVFNDIRILNIYINKKVNGKKIEKLIPADVEAFLYSGNLPNLKDNIFKKYVPSESFLCNICVNAFFKVLDVAKERSKDVRIALLDPEGCYFSLLEKLIFYSKDIAVISNNLKVYTEEQRRLMKNYGAAFFLNSSEEHLFNYNLIIAPKEIRRPIFLKKDSAVFTSCESKASISGTVYYKYKFNKFLYLNEILPADISQELFLAALYDIYKIRKLSEFIPNYCFNGYKYLTVKDLIASKKL